MTSGNVTTENRADNPDDVRGQLIPELTWRPSGSRYYAQDLRLGMAAEVGRSGSARWYVKAWPVALTPCPDRYVRHVTGLRSMADARAMAVRMPCFRCGRGRPLILMEPYTARFRCTARAECEAERARLLAPCGSKACACRS